MDEVKTFAELGEDDLERLKEICEQLHSDPIKLATLEESKLTRLSALMKRVRLRDLSLSFSGRSVLI